MNYNNNIIYSDEQCNIFSLNNFFYKRLKDRPYWNFTEDGKVVLYDYGVRKKVDPKITLLSQENNVFRSYLSAMCITLLLLGYEQLSIVCPLLKENTDFILVFSLSVLFLFSYIKQTAFVKKRIKANLD